MQGKLRGPWQGSRCHVLIGDLKKEPGGKFEPPTNDATGYSLRLPAVGKGFLVLSRLSLSLGSWEKHFPSPSPARGLCDGAGEMQAREKLTFFQYSSLKNFSAKLYRFTDLMLVEQFSLWDMF